MSTHSGYGATLDEAVDAAARSALADWKPRGADDMASVRLDSVEVLYGGIAGHTGTRVAYASLGTGSDVAGLDAAPIVIASDLSLKLEVLPRCVYANLMPPVHRPQRHGIALLLTVTNTGTALYQGQSSSSVLVRFSVLHDRKAVWESSAIAADVITPVSLRPNEARTFRALWNMEDVVPLVAADLHAVAEFVPTGATAMHPIEVRPVF